MPSFDDIRRNSSNYAYSGNPGFFTPFQSESDFFSTLVKPITGPLLLGTLTILFAVGAVASAALGVGLIALGLITTPLILCAPEVPVVAYSIGFSLCSSALDLAMGAFILAIGTVLCLVLNPITLVTRSAASVINELANCCDAESQELLYA
ncbi:MAG: hypothetical protein H0T84_14370 [Tatlockia sp.]|nr:hypothetical protein [Tatlockia sp.]